MLPVVPPVPFVSAWDLFMRRPHLRDLPPLPLLPREYELQTMNVQTQAGVAEVLRLSFGEDVWTFEHVQREFVEAPDVLRTFVVMRDGMAAATASVRLVPEIYPESGYLHYVGVHPAHQGQRLGYFLALVVLHEFVELGCRDAVLETDDFRVPAIKTYLKLGFVPENRHSTHAQRWQHVLLNLEFMAHRSQSS
jgi:mycothiol synthase